MEGLHIGSCCSTPMSGRQKIPHQSLPFSEIKSKHANENNMKFGRRHKKKSKLNNGHVNTSKLISKGGLETDFDWDTDSDWETETEEAEMNTTKEKQVSKKPLTEDHRNAEIQPNNNFDQIVESRDPECIRDYNIENEVDFDAPSLFDITESYVPISEIDIEVLPVFDSHLQKIIVDNDHITLSCPDQFEHCKTYVRDVKRKIASKVREKQSNIADNLINCTFPEGITKSKSYFSKSNTNDIGNYTNSEACSITETINNKIKDKFPFGSTHRANELWDDFMKENMLINCLSKTDAEEDISYTSSAVPMKKFFSGTLKTCHQSDRTSKRRKENNCSTNNNSEIKSGKMTIKNDSQSNTMISNSRKEMSITSNNEYNSTIELLTRLSTDVTNDKSDNMKKIEVSSSDLNENDAVRKKIPTALRLRSSSTDRNNVSIREQNENRTLIKFQSEQRMTKYFRWKSSLTEFDLYSKYENPTHHKVGATESDKYHLENKKIHKKGDFMSKKTYPKNKILNENKLLEDLAASKPRIPEEKENHAFQATYIAEEVPKIRSIEKITDRRYKIVKNDGMNEKKDSLMTGKSILTPKNKIMNEEKLLEDPNASNPGIPEENGNHAFQATYKTMKTQKIISDEKINCRCCRHYKIVENDGMNEKEGSLMTERSVLT